MTKDRFDSPFSVTTPPGAEGWEDLYHYHLLFSEARKTYDESVFWFRDAIHLPTVMPPFDASLVEYAFASLGSYNSRHYIVPPAMGIDIRILNGYFYLSPVPVADPSDIPGRVEHFMQRAGHYFANWDAIEAEWIDKAKVVIGKLEALNFEPLPDMVALDVVTGHAGRSNVYDLQHEYHQLVDLSLELWQLHFEMLNLGYAAYLDYFGFCKQVFPNIPDLSIAKMVAGIDVDLFRPDEELRRLARLAVDSGLGDTLCEGTVDQALAAVEAAAGGEEWLAEYATAQYPWFNYSNGTGFYHTDAVWAERLDIPFSFIRGYIRKLQAGEEIDTPQEAVIAERDRVASEYIDLLDGDDKANFEAKLGLSRTVFHYVENHNFYVEHWGISVMWRKIRELSNVFIKEGFWADRRRHLHAEARRHPDGHQRHDLCLVCRSRTARPVVLARCHRQAPGDHGRVPGMGCTAGSRRTARRRHRALHDHAVGHHQRLDPEVARRCQCRRWPQRFRRVTRSRRGHRPCVDERRSGLGDRRRRDPRRSGDRSVVGADLPSHRRDGDRLGRDDEPRRDRVPRVRTAGRHRHRVRDEVDQDRHAPARRRRQRRRDDPRLVPARRIARPRRRTR